MDFRVLLPADKIKTEVQLAPSAPFAFGFMLFLKPFALAEDLQAGTVDNQLDWSAHGRVWRFCQSQPIAPAR